jgi:putative transposase
MIINKAYKTELDPNDEQIKALRNHAGAARWAYNWALGHKIDYYKITKRTLSYYDLSKLLTILKHIPKVDGGCNWINETTACISQQAMRDVEIAFKNFFRRCANGEKEKGFPQFKIKREGYGSFRVSERSLRATEFCVNLPKIGEIKLKEKNYLPTKDRKNIKILSATVSEENHHWFVSFSVEETIPDPIQPIGEPLGIDVGVSHLATLSDGTVFENPKAASKNKERTRLLQKAVSRKKKGSNNRKKAQRKLAKHHKHIANIRKDAINKATSEVIAKRPEFIVVEDLTVKNLLKNHKLAGAISDAAMSEFIRQLIYKAFWAGIPVYKANRFFPSSKACSHCGTINESLTLEDRVFKCECGFQIDRDLNAAINLREYGRESHGYSLAMLRSSGQKLLSCDETSLRQELKTSTVPKGNR